MPPPFTADEVRAATPNGRTWVFRIDSPDSPAIWRRVVSLDADADGCRLAGSMHDADGRALSEPQVRKVSWQEMVDEATFPDDAVVADAPLTTPFGEVPAQRYSRTAAERGGGELTTTAWFAPSLPGAPIRHEVARDGRVVARLVLEEHVAGGASDQVDG